MSYLRATYYDGEASRGALVTLACDEQLLFIEGHGLALRVERQAVVLTPRIGRALRVLRLPRGHLECADCAELEVWFGARSSRVERCVDWLERRWPVLLAATVAVIAGAVLFVTHGLPWLAREVAEELPVSAQDAVGRWTLDLFDEKYLGASELSEERQQALGEKFQKLVEGLPQQNRFRLEFRGGKRFGANAFALPDGRIVLLDGLVARAQSDDELLGVLAHEAGHHEHRHHLRSAIQSSGVAVLISLMLGDVATASSLGAAIPTILLQSGYSRDFEREADRFAVELLVKKGIPGASFANALRRLQERRGAESECEGQEQKQDDRGESEPSRASQLGALISTHPEMEERIREVNRYAEELERKRGEPAQAP